MELRYEGSWNTRPIKTKQTTKKNLYMVKFLYIKINSLACAFNLVAKTHVRHSHFIIGGPGFVTWLHLLTPPSHSYRPQETMLTCPGWASAIHTGTWTEFPAPGSGLAQTQPPGEWTSTCNLSASLLQNLIQKLSFNFTFRKTFEVFQYIWVQKNSEIHSFFINHFFVIFIPFIDMVFNFLQHNKLNL